MDDSKENIAKTSRRFESRLFALSIFAFVLLVSTLAAPQSVHAGGGIGGGGSGRGGGGARGSGYPNTIDGYGWYKFQKDGSTGAPGSMRNGGSWTDVVANCASQHANSIITFIILRPDKKISTSMVYDFQDQYSTADTRKYLGGNGYPWVNYTDAYNAFVALGAQGVPTSSYAYGGPNGTVGWFCSDFQAPPWDVSPFVAADKSTATPGDTITWTHSVKNNGPSPATGITYGYSSDGKGYGPTTINNQATSTSTSTQLVTQADVGNDQCRTTYATPKSSSDTGIIASVKTCVSVPYNYALTPTMTTTHNSSASVGASIDFTPHVTNSGPTKSQAVDWQVTEFVVSPGSTPPDGGVSPNVPCSFYKSNVTSCTSPLKDSNGNDIKGNTVFDGSATSKVTNSTTDLTGVGYTYTVPDLPVGSRVCFAQSVKPNSSSDANWRHSTPVCVVVSKSPLVHVLGGDLRVGAAFVGSDSLFSQITTSVTVKTNKSYGSWDEYAIAASGSITGMASGSAYKDGLSCASNCATNNLTFANFKTLGNFKPTTPIPDVAASFPVTTSTLPFSSLADSVNRRVETASLGADIKIDGGNIIKGNWLVINAPTSTVTITGDITYDSSSLQSVADIPQLVIIANQINIEGNVKNVDAWLIASGSVGTINTCSAWKTLPVAPSDKLSSDICSDPLVINGPVMAKTLYLRRTAGAGNGPDKSDNPAEVINLRPDAYLWGLARVSQSGRLTTVYETELPPRF